MRTTRHFGIVRGFAPLALLALWLLLLRHRRLAEPEPWPDDY